MDIFVARVAGSIENDDIVGSMELAAAVAGSKVILVLGHTVGGTVKQMQIKTQKTQIL